MLAKRIPQIILLVLVAATALTSCGSHWPSELTWKEEVRLSDGRMIQVERHERYRVASELGGLNNLITESAELRVLLTSSEELPLLKVGDVSRLEMPLIIDVSAGTYFAITIVNRCYQAKDAGLDPHKPYFEYRLVDGAWIRRPVSDEKNGWKSNLLVHLALAKERSFISVAEKAAANGNPSIETPYNTVSPVPCG